MDRAYWTGTWYIRQARLEPSVVSY